VGTIRSADRILKKGKPGTTRKSVLVKEKKGSKNNKRTCFSRMASFPEEKKKGGKSLWGNCIYSRGGDTGQNKGERTKLLLLKFIRGKKHWEEGVKNETKHRRNLLKKWGGAKGGFEVKISGGKELLSKTKKG